MHAKFIGSAHGRSMRVGMALLHRSLEVAGRVQRIRERSSVAPPRSGRRPSPSPASKSTAVAAADTMRSAPRIAPRARCGVSMGRASASPGGRTLAARRRSNQIADQETLIRMITFFFFFK